MIQRETRLAMTEGAVVGGPFIVLVPVAFCAALLTQAQMVFELAAVAGRDPTDQMRAADLLVVLGAYGSTQAATEGLEAMTRDPQQREGKRLPAGTRWNTVKRMAYLLQVLGPTDATRSGLRSTLGWTGVSVLFVVGIVLPLVWVPYMAYATRRSSLGVGGRAVALYADGDAADAGVNVRRR